MEVNELKEILKAGTEFLVHGETALVTRVSEKSVWAIHPEQFNWNGEGKHKESRESWNTVTDLFNCKIYTVKN